MISSEDAVTTDAQAIGRVAPPSDSIRITRQGKIRHWVKHGLDFFENNPDKPLTLQTVAADVTQSTIPRLISVVEILKREYLKTLDVSSGQLTGLHQYNELQWEQRGEIPTEGEDRAANIPDEETSPKLSLAPSMKVTLCTKALAGMHEKKDVTYQIPQTRRLSKTAKARMKKREREKNK
ncbi:hypothetical protein AZE42_09961 [Rhizopogon vesiculosus]|uniref:Uncharacterized protein n=1 Tax=Rhizopogon vesiculosus TaxID=180088 RepID=A0A1J8R1U4_9AGAM|nr:hypothetical protein AZE42_09961 [Rhizopogon vesiculosus]